LLVVALSTRVPVMMAVLVKAKGPTRPAGDLDNVTIAQVCPMSL
jgi:hypothetical protein